MLRTTSPVYCLIQYLPASTPTAPGFPKGCEYQVNSYPTNRGWDILGHQLPLLVFVMLFAGMIVLRHRSSISRLIAGIEHRFEKKRLEGTVTLLRMIP